MPTISPIKWTEESIEHISRHAVKPAEVEDACFNEDEPPFVRFGSGNLHYVFGRTYAGRFLFIVVKFIRAGEIKVITARDMNTWKEIILRKGVSDMKKIPKFKTDEDAARFWETHSFEDYYGDTKTSDLRFIKKPKKTVAIRLDPKDIKSVEIIAERKGLSYTSLLRMWIKEHLAKEIRRVA